jgi:hypothetical protein
MLLNYGRPLLNFPWPKLALKYSNRKWLIRPTRATEIRANPLLSRLVTCQRVTLTDTIYSYLCLLCPVSVSNKRVTLHKDVVKRD